MKHKNDGKPYFELWEKWIAEGAVTTHHLIEKMAEEVRRRTAWKVRELESEVERLKSENESLRESLNFRIRQAEHRERDEEQEDLKEFTKAALTGIADTKPDSNIEFDEHKGIIAFIAVEFAKATLAQLKKK